MIKLFTLCEIFSSAISCSEISKGQIDSETIKKRKLSDFKDHVDGKRLKIYSDYDYSNANNSTSCASTDNTILFATEDEDEDNFKFEKSEYCTDRSELLENSKMNNVLETVQTNEIYIIRKKK